MNCDRDTVKQLDNAAGCRSRGPLETSVDGRGVQETRHTGRGGYQEVGSSSLSPKGRCGEKTARDVYLFRQMKLYPTKD